MRAIVDIDTNGERGFVTLLPNWFERLLGLRASRGAVERVKATRRSDQDFVWVWEATGRVVEEWIERAIELREVVSLPQARLTSGGKS